MKKNKIGKLFILVEGTVYEHKLLRNIFKNVFSVEIVSDRNRNMFLSNDAIEQIDVLINEDNLIVIKTGPKSQLHSTLDELDEYDEIPKFYGVKNASSFNTVILYDKDVESGNNHNRIANFFAIYNDIFEKGLLTISYPSVEAIIYYLNKDQLIEVFNAVELKQLVTKRIPQIDEELFLKSMIKHYDFVNNLVDANPETNEDLLTVVDLKLEEYYNNNQKWKVISMFYLVFVELGII